jgi:hypothetical protein
MEARQDERMSAYLDTCIVSGLVKEDLAESELDALAIILRLHKDGRLEVVTSAVTEGELSRLPDDVRRRHLTIYTLLHDVPVSEVDYTDSGLMLMGVGGGRRDKPLYAELKSMLPDEPDAQHVFQAIDARVRYFVTTDEKTILRHAGELEQRYELVALLPSQLLARIDGD